MEKIPSNETEPSPEWITEAALISFAKERPLRDPEVEEMLIRWLKETGVPNESGVNAIDCIDAAIKHSVMKYRLGFLSKEEALQELEQAGGCLASERSDTKVQHLELSQLMYDIEDGVIVVVRHKE
jgi:heat shock protein HspQ